MSLYRSCRARDRSGQRERCIHGLWGHPLLLPQVQSRLCLHHGPEVGSCGRSWDLPWDKGPGCLFVRIMATASSCERLKQTPLPSGEILCMGKGMVLSERRAEARKSVPGELGSCGRRHMPLQRPCKASSGSQKVCLVFALHCYRHMGRVIQALGMKCVHVLRVHTGHAAAHTVGPRHIR